METLDILRLLGGVAFMGVVVWQVFVAKVKYDDRDDRNDWFRPGPSV